MPISLDALLAPVSAESPCGPDLSYDPKFQELEILLQGKPETQFSAAEPPDWSKVRTACLEEIGRSKHLRLTVILAGALLRLEGVAGFRDVLTLVEAWVSRYWETVYPLLDPDDNNDPTERLNIIAGFTTPISADGGATKIIAGLRRAPLSASPQMGRFSLHEVQRSQTGTEEEGKPPAPAGQVEASFRDTPPEALAATLAAVEQCQALVKSLAAQLGERVASDRVPAFDALTGTLREMQKLLANYTSSGSSPAMETAASLALEAPVSSPAAASVGGPRAGFSGSINSREEVLRALDAITRYYAAQEPSSPLPLLLERAKRMVPMDFLAIMRDWAPEALDKVNVIAGLTGEEKS